MNMKNIHSTYIKDLQQEFRAFNFKRIVKKNGMYITNVISGNMDNDRKIFKETQVKRMLRGPSAPFVSNVVKNKLSYFSQNENENMSLIYKLDDFQNLESEDYAIHNIGHATQLIQTSGFNILTDPVFNNLFPIFYPAKTESHPSIKDLPIIDIVIISHNHRDHVDHHSMKKLLQRHKENDWPQPMIFVPKEDKKLFEKYGFEDVEEVEWYTKISITKNTNGLLKSMDLISIPADHRSGRYFNDHHKSLVTGWIVSPKQEDVLFKYSGDTRALPSENQEAIDAVLWHEIKNKTRNIGKNNHDVEIPDIICLEPSGPNYTRCYMDVTHQSASYSTLLKFVEAENLSQLSSLPPDKFLEKMKTVMMHHNKYELGPDRFNEGLFIFKKLVQYLSFSEENLTREHIRQKKKLTQKLDREKLKKNLPFTSRPILSRLPEYTSLLVHAKDFVITDILNMTNKYFDREIIKRWLINNTIFMKIGERMNNVQIMSSKVDLKLIHKYNGNLNR